MSAIPLSSITSHSKLHFEKYQLKLNGSIVWQVNQVKSIRQRLEMQKCGSGTMVWRRSASCIQPRAKLGWSYITRAWWMLKLTQANRRQFLVACDEPVASSQVLQKFLVEIRGQVAVRRYFRPQWLRDFRFDYLWFIGTRSFCFRSYRQ